MAFDEKHLFRNRKKSVQPKWGSSLIKDTKYPFRKSKNNKFCLHPSGLKEGDNYLSNRRRNTIEYMNNIKKSKKNNSSILGIILKDLCDDGV